MSCLMQSRGLASLPTPGALERHSSASLLTPGATQPGLSQKWACWPLEFPLRRGGTSLPKLRAQPNGHFLTSGAAVFLPSPPELRSEPDAPRVRGAVTAAGEPLFLPRRLFRDVQFCFFA